MISNTAHSPEQCLWSLSLSKDVLHRVVDNKNVANYDKTVSLGIALSKCRATICSVLFFYIGDALRLCTPPPPLCWLDGRRSPTSSPRSPSRPCSSDWRRQTPPTPTCPDSAGGARSNTDPPHSPFSRSCSLLRASASRAAPRYSEHGPISLSTARLSPGWTWHGPTRLCRGRVV